VRPLFLGIVNTKAPGDGRSRNGTKSMRASDVDDPYNVALKLKSEPSTVDAANCKTWGRPRSVVAKWSLYGNDRASISLYKVTFFEAFNERKNGTSMDNVLFFVIVPVEPYDSARVHSDGVSRAHGSGRQVQVTSLMPATAVVFFTEIAVVGTFVEVDVNVIV
jgi:hypothetical protein